VLQGISINLIGADPGTTVTIGLQADRTAIRGRLDAFVSAYNEVVAFVNEQNELGEDSRAVNLLFGDGLLRSVQSTLRRTLFNQNPLDVGSNEFGTLGLLGIRLQSDGTLSVDGAVLDEKLAADLDAFAELFVDSDGFDNGGVQPGDPGYNVDTTADSGLADDLMRALDGLLKSSSGAGGARVSGVFDARVEGLRDSIELINDQIERSEARLERTEELLVARFTALETLLGQLNSQSAFLNQSLA
jgi:flagellar hook-associated protein 2